MMMILLEKEDKRWTHVFFQSISHSSSWCDVTEKVRLSCHRLANNGANLHEVRTNRALMDDVQTMMVSSQSIGVQTENTLAAAQTECAAAHRQTQRHRKSSICLLM